MTRTRTAPHLRYGDRLSFTGGVESPPVFDDFDYRDYLARQGVGAVARFPALTLDAKGAGSPLLRRVYALRATLSESLQRSLPEPASALARSLLLGQRRGLPDEVRQDFIETGTSHLLAISGLHVAILLGAALALGRMLFGGARWALLLALVAVWTYAMVSGMSPSVTRAALMGSVFLLGRALGREGASLPALAAAAAAMTALDPRLLGNVSFQLSFTAVMGLLLLAPPLEARLGPSHGAGHRRRRPLPLPSGAPQPPRWQPASPQPSAPCRSSPWSLRESPTWASRRRSWPCPHCPLRWPRRASPPWRAQSGLRWASQPGGWRGRRSRTCLAVAGAAARLPGGLLEFGGVTPVMVWGYYALLAGAAYGLRKLRDDDDSSTPTSPRPLRPAGGRLRWAALATLLACAVVWVAAVTAPDGRLTVTFLDVGQGDAIFIQTPSGKQLLIDGGPDPEALHRELGRVMPFWDRSLDLIVLTHPDADHLNGLVSVLERYEVALVAETGVGSASAQYASWQALAGRAKTEAVLAFAGQELSTGDGVIISVLNPPEDVPAWTPDLRNNSGVTLRVSYGEVSFLLPADIHRYTEEVLVASGASLGSTVLKAAHHGSATSSSQAFLNAVQPEVVVVSAGRNNKFGHPAPEVVERLTAAVGAGNVYVTAEHGRVRFSTNGERLWRKTAR